MTLPTILVVIGAALAVLGLAGLGVCVVKALAVKRSGDAETGLPIMQKLVALNMASVGIAAIGLAAIVVGLILQP